MKRLTPGMAMQEMMTLRHGTLILGTVRFTSIITAITIPEDV